MPLNKYREILETRYDNTNYKDNLLANILSNTNFMPINIRVITLLI
jgi:hypothetical protein